MWDKIRVLFLRLWGTFWFGVIPLWVIWSMITTDDNIFGAGTDRIWNWIFGIGFLAIFGLPLLVMLVSIWKDDSLYDDDDLTKGMYDQDPF